MAGPAVLDLIPWDSAPEQEYNAKKREEARELIAYAHELGMKYYSFANEFTFHPSLIKATGASLDPCDPAFWNAVQEKFRMLFQALPELDGIELCNDDISGFWDGYRAYDPLHETPGCEWSYAKRFRTFVQKVHEVVADEFDKTYFHFTWGLTAHEQHYQAAVFREIFTDAVPTNNLYLVPKITCADRWWHQPYNPTFNQTPHDTVVCFETMNYYEGGNTHLFPTFAGAYYQGGLETFLLPEKSNVRGIAGLAGQPANSWDTRSAYTYVLYRLSWDPYDDMENIARDFCAMNFGPAAAEAMAQIYFLSPKAYKYGLHIEPVSYGQYNSFIHMRVGTFPVEGYPSIDGGKEHLEFLHKIYLRCKPWSEETLEDLDHGLNVARDMEARFAEVRGRIADQALAEEAAERLQMTRLLIATNNGYVRTFMALFDYFGHPEERYRKVLENAYDALTSARDQFMAAPGFHYNLFGVDQVIKNARAALEDVAAAKEALDRAPSRSQLEATIMDQQRRYTDVLKQYSSEAVALGRVEAMIDGRDILTIQGNVAGIEHLRWDPPEVRVLEIATPLPAQEVTVIPKDVYSRPIHPFVLEQPSAKNDFTARIYLDDLPGSKDWVICELYYIPRSPAELGLQLPWEKEK